MSRSRIGYNLNERKYSLKFMIYILILFDLILFSSGVHYQIILNLLGWEGSLIVGLLIGLRGQARYRALMFELQAIANDPKYDNDEDLRGHLLRQQIRYDCVEYDIWMRKQDFKKGKSTQKKNKKKTKKIKRGVKIKMNEQAIKELLYWVAGLWLGFTGILADVLIMFQLRPLWIIAIVFTVGLGDFLFFWYLKNFWGIEKEDVEPIPPITRTIPEIEAEIASLNDPT